MDGDAVADARVMAGSMNGAALAGCMIEGIVRTIEAARSITTIVAILRMNRGRVLRVLIGNVPGRNNF